MSAEPAGTLAGDEAGAATEVHRAPLDELGPGRPAGAARELRLLADVPVELSVEVGRSRLTMRDLLSLVPGSVLALDHPANAAVDVLVNGRLVARGEVVVVEGDSAIRVTEIVG